MTTFSDSDSWRNALLHVVYPFAGAPANCAKIGATCVNVMLVCNKPLLACALSLKHSLGQARATLGYISYPS